MIRRLHLGIVATMLAVSSGCCSGPTLILPKVALERCDWPKHPDPVFIGPGGAGPIFSEPHIVHGPACCKSPCGGCCPPGRPVQPIDPFGWLKQGSQGTQVVDPIGWVTGI